MRGPFAAGGEDFIAGREPAEEKFERADLVAAEGRGGEIVALDPELARKCVVSELDTLNGRREVAERDARDAREGWEAEEEWEGAQLIITDRRVVGIIIHPDIVPQRILDVQHLDRHHHRREQRHCDHQSEESEQ